MGYVDMISMKDYNTESDYSSDQVTKFRKTMAQKEADFSNNS